MKERIKLLSLVVGNTVTLLAIAAVLIVIGIFNESLNWDIFGPRAEAILYGIFGSCIALAIVGVAMTVVMGVQEIVKSFKALERERAATGTPEIVEASTKKYAERSMYLMLAMALIITTLAVANHRILVHRSAVYKRLAEEQMNHFAPKISLILASMTSPPRNNVSSELHDLVRTLDSLSFISKTTLYLPDPQDPSAMWGYTAWRGYDKRDGFARFFVAKDFEKAMRKALDGDARELDNINRRATFEFYRVINDTNNFPAAVIRLDGNSGENFREYALGS